MAEPLTRRVADSALETSYLVLPEHTNAMGNIFGGTVMAWIDMLAACVSLRHCRTQVVTASMDDLHFINPVKLGDLVILRGSVNYTGRTSLEVGIKVMAENPFTGVQLHTSSAYLTFVALDAAGKPILVPTIVPESDIEKRRFNDGRTRRDFRIERKKALSWKV